MQAFTGGEGQDTVNGGGGDDTIILGTQAADGTDDILGGTGVDTISIAAGQSFVFSTADSKLQGVENVQLGSGASVTLTGQTEGFNVIGGGGAETIITSTGNDTVNAGLGNDFIQAAAGADVINGGAGLDTVSYADVTGTTSHGQVGLIGMAVNFTGEAIADATIVADFTPTGGVLAVTGNDDPNAQLSAGTVQYLTVVANKAATSSVDTLTGIEGFVGSALDDYIVLGADAVTVDAGAGRDIVFSGTAVDNINAGAGDDVINIGAASDHTAAETITGGDGADVIQFNSVLGETLVLSANVTGVETVNVATSDGAAGGTTNENVDASAVTAGIAINGNDGDNRITGSAFADTLDGNNGDDTYVVTNGDTIVETAAEGTDVMILAESATFAAAGLEAVDTALIGSGMTLTVDHSDVAGADDLLTITGVADGATETLVITGSTLGNAATLDLTAVAITNVIVDYRGGADIDTFVGTAAADIISGGFGADVIDGNGGADTISGGDGFDTFTIAGNDSATTIVTITDYEVGDATPNADTLDIIDATLNPAVTRADLFSAVTLSSGQTVESIAVSATGVVTFFDENVALAGTQELFAITDADVVALSEALLLNLATAGAYTFGLDADANGTAESSIVLSSDLTETNIVELVGVAGGTDLATAVAAGDILIA